ncbi:hypothetical protein CWI39_0126p0060 [Hamiltosporidium magnivora]|uniref:Uncharacterized protein n=1 Tax=Hamiltosporidium magnivora TaxID=148818 RepID=A0A4Q9LNQ2_9MICR|nr:hypothetical protein CWI39_0126p0060 [Hamiltosporidium magnivora]
MDILIQKIEELCIQNNININLSLDILNDTPQQEWWNITYIKKSKDLFYKKKEIKFQRKQEIKKEKQKIKFLKIQQKKENELLYGNKGGVIGNEDEDMVRGVTDSREGEGVIDSIYNYKGASNSIDKQQGATNSIYNYKGASNSIDKQQGVNASIHSYKGATSSIDNYKGATNSTYEQNPLNNSTNTLHPFNNTPHPLTNTNIGVIIFISPLNYNTSYIRKGRSITYNSFILNIFQTKKINENIKYFKKLKFNILWFSYNCYIYTEYKEIKYFKGIENLKEYFFIKEGCWYIKGVGGVIYIGIEGVSYIGVEGVSYIGVGGVSYIGVVGVSYRGVGGVIYIGML